MKAKFLLQILVVSCLFIFAFALELMPWPAAFQSFKPSWLMLVLFYWILAIPNKVSIGTAFVLGIIWDLILGSILGVHALVLSIFAYLIASNYLVLRNLSLWFQGILTILFVLAIRFSIFLIEFFLYGANFNWQEIFGAIASGILWPWVFLLLRKIRRKLDLR